MKFEIIRAFNTKSSTWSGGTTSEIYIFPNGSEFQKRDFLFRLSAATVEVEESIFTPLPEINRTLMVLEGNIHLFHENHHAKKLSEFEQDSFKGDWNTKSKGKVTDFNLMCKGKTSGELKHIQLKESQPSKIDLSSEKELFFVVNGSLIFENQILEKGDLLAFENENHLQEIKFSSNFCDLIQIKIDLGK
jgi:environmental stress-induced protein Ves